LIRTDTESEETIMSWFRRLLGGGAVRSAESSKIKADLDPALAAEAMKGGLMIVFGPDFDEVTGSIAALQATGALGGLVLPRRSVHDLSLPDAKVSGAWVMFTHFIPSKRGEQITESDVTRWKYKLLSGAGFNREAVGSPEVKWYCEQCNKIALSLFWKEAEVRVCVAVAQSLQQSYIASGGSFPG
jgi:hypothetical protein